MYDLTDKKVFLSGPITGLDIDTYTKAFDDARARVRALGATTVFSPIDRIPETTSHADAMCVCLHELCRLSATSPDIKPHYDLLVSLPGWEDSVGARIEREAAESMGVPCITLEDVDK